MSPDPRPQDVQATFAATLVDEWVLGGLRAAVVCPGSRSTPLALALADHPAVGLHVHHDERSGGFMALGLALASGRPVAVLTTSGTAATELHPAVVEAHHAGVPLLVCSADRPPELRDVGAPQAIDQTRLYGAAVRWFADPGVPVAAGSGRWRAFAARAFTEAAGPPPGPVHLNLPFREPLVGVPGPLPPGRGDRPWARVERPLHLPAEARPPGADAIARPAADAATGGGAAAPSPRGAPPGPGGAAGLWGRLRGRRGLILAGHPGPEPGDLAAVAEALGWPVVPDPRSSAWVPGPHTVAHLDAILRSERARAALRPEVILRLGASPASRVVNEWCAASRAEEVVVPGHGWSDPSGTAAVVVPGAPADVVAALAAEAGPGRRGSGHGPGPEDGRGRGPGGDGGGPGAGEWLGLWRAVADVAAAALHEALAALPPTPSEPGLARDVVAGLPAGSRLVVSSSMPIRDVERYAGPRADLRVLANRGANGIDGVVSTAVGVALAERHAEHRSPTGLLIGDLAFLHDSNGLLGIAARGIDLVVTVVDNDGGGIFSFLPQAGSLADERFEDLFGTPHGLDLVAVGQSYGVAARSVERDVAKAVRSAAEEGGVQVLVVRTDRAANVEVHRRLDQAVAFAADTVLASLGSGSDSTVIE